MKKIKHKLQDSHGVSILFALLLMAVAAMVSITIISASLSAVKRSHAIKNTRQELISLDSATLYIEKQLNSDSGASEVSFQNTDGTYSVTGNYGEHAASTMEVSLTLGDGTINDVTVTPTNTSAISQRYSKAFVKQIEDVIVGKELKDLKLDTVAGASWTTEAFNTALVNIRGDASAAAVAQ